MKTKTKKELKNIEILPKDNEGKVDLGTRWPSTIGRKVNSNDDGKVRDINGNILS